MPDNAQKRKSESLEDKTDVRLPRGSKARPTAEYDLNKEILMKNGHPDSIRLMKTRTTGLILALCFFGAALCFADDQQMATANSNESKSKPTSGTEKVKPTYISLVRFTDKGIQGAKQTTQRLAAARIP